MPTYYIQSQRGGIGSVVTDAGYRICRKFDMTDRRILEIGPGDLTHLKHWQGTPKRYVIADVRSEILQGAQATLRDRGIDSETVLLERTASDLPFGDGEFDTVLCFYTLEHLYPFDTYVKELQRVLMYSGVLAGAIPCEGGLAWGCGRLLTTRRWLRKNTSIDPDKIICWEHPNFAEQILENLDERFNKEYLGFWPTPIPIIDTNLVITFIYSKVRE